MVRSCLFVPDPPRQRDRCSCTPNRALHRADADADLAGDDRPSDPQRSRGDDPDDLVLADTEMANGAAAAAIPLGVATVPDRSGADFTHTPL
jgi:hypothetical protein